MIRNQKHVRNVSLDVYNADLSINAMCADQLLGETSKETANAYSTIKCYLLRL